MLFSSLDFIIFFVIVIGAISLFKFRKFQHILIIISSFYFLFYTDNFLVTLLILTILLHFYTGREIYKSKDPKIRKIFLIVGILGSLSLLGFFKYFSEILIMF